MNITLRNLPPHIRLQDILGELREKFGCTFRWVDGEVIGEFSEARPAHTSNVVPLRADQRQESTQ